MEQTKQIRLFLFSQHFADGLRVTLAIIAPSLAGAFLGDLESGINASLGALCLSISDAPGPLIHKRNGMFYCLAFVILMALLTGFLNHYIWTMGVLIAAATFFFSMFNIYGIRAASIATASLLIMILLMPVQLSSEKVLTLTLQIALGGMWYMAISMTFYLLIPYRPVQRALGDCIIETSKYLRIKSSLYDVRVDFKSAYDQLISQQSVVSDKQNMVRELLFKSRAINKESSFESRRLLVTFVETVDLFEQIMATWYNYEDLRKKYHSLNVLPKISVMIDGLANELLEIGQAIHSQSGYNSKINLMGRLSRFKQETEATLGSPLDFTLRKIIINMRDLGRRIDGLSRYFSEGREVEKTNLKRKDYLRFVPHQKINGALFLNNLNMQSSAFRHSLRVLITCLAGYILAKMIFTGEHSYWILMTIIIIMKPAYSLTRKKNMDRLTGTLLGAIIGLLLLYFIKDEKVLFGILVFCMLGTYTFVRVNYAVMVTFLTPYILILFHFLKLDVLDIAGERLIDTIIACLLSWIAMHFLFPDWESKNIKTTLLKVLQANLNYLKQLRMYFQQMQLNRVEYKLVRKDVFVSTANLSAALHRMQSEPKRRQQNQNEIYELVVLNHVLSSNIASLIGSAPQSNEVSSAYFRRIDGSIANLQDGIEKLSGLKSPEITRNGTTEKSAKTSGDFSALSQLNFIEKLSGDIKRIVGKIKPDKLLSQQ
ncbi:MAG: FUSC family protein [Chitinophagaceae bacterium]|nr:FUSC family protein [Chitinophagaceae bacterium]